MTKAFGMAKKFNLSIKVVAEIPKFGHSQNELFDHRHYRLYPEF